MSKIDKDELKALLKEVEEESPEVEKAEEKVEPAIEASLNTDKILGDVAEKLVSMVQEKLGGDAKDAEALKEKIYTPEEGLKAVKYPELKELDNLDDTTKIGVYFKALFSRTKTEEDYAVLKGLSEGTAADGGNLVPTPLYTEVVRLLNDMAIMRKLATIVPMTSDTLKIPTLVANPLAYWIEERKTKTTTSAEFSYVTLDTNKLVARILISEELNDDAIVAMVPFITQLFAEEIARAEDAAFFNGNGTGQPRGIAIETLTSTNAGGTFNFDDVISLLNSVRQSVRSAASGAFVGHNHVIQKLQILKDGNNNYIWRNGGLMDGQSVMRLPDMIFNRPIYEQNDLPDDELYYGDWSKYYIGDRKQLYVKTTDQNETAWTTDAIDVKAVERIDGRAAILAAFAKVINC